MRGIAIIAVIVPMGILLPIRIHVLSILFVCCVVELVTFTFALCRKIAWRKMSVVVINTQYDIRSNMMH